MFAVARGATPFAATMVTVIESPVFTTVPPPTVLAAVMVVAVNDAALTDVTEKEPLNGQELHVFPVGGVPVRETDTVPLARAEAEAVTVQVTVCCAPAGTVAEGGSADLLHPDGTLRPAATAVQFPLPVPVYLRVTLNA